MELTDVFGSNVFSDKVMQGRLPKDVYKALKETIEKDVPLRQDIANVVANAMKDWAVEKGATHYTHWFQPLTGITAEKHDSFISPAADGSGIVEFSGKQLIQGEPDASSFPSGGLRTTFEARGYTAWDCTSPAFLKEDESGNVTLTIPTAFYSYYGEALDKKTPLLRSMKAVSEQALRVLKALGNVTATKVTSTVGPEQEYFLVDKEFYMKRLDLLLTGRTIFGAPAPKGQELEDQYFGSIKDRVSDYMQDLNTELWKMGITSKTQHNEVAPTQYEMAPLYTTTNIATDHNQLVMETMQKVALRHDLVCLLHEKPYAGINGSGKHNNWSLSTDDGVNLLEPGQTPGENVQFLLFLSALIKAVDIHADILRATCASAGNDHRLGANEAPPAIVSIFMGEELTDILEKLSKGQKVAAKGAQYMKVGVDTLPEIPKDNTDRNRTSPFAFTGNKFEFRAVPSSLPLGFPNTVLNLAVADSLNQICAHLESLLPVASSEESAILQTIKHFITASKSIRYEGDNYRNGQCEANPGPNPNGASHAPAALKALVSDATLKLFAQYKVLTQAELEARYRIKLDQYIKTLNIEANTLIHMIRSYLVPAALSYLHQYAVPDFCSDAVKNCCISLDAELTALLDKTDQLERAMAQAEAMDNEARQAEFCAGTVSSIMQACRVHCDELERKLGKGLYPLPSYHDLLFSFIK